MVFYIFVDGMDDEFLNVFFEKYKKEYVGNVLEGYKNAWGSLFQLREICHY